MATVPDHYADGALNAQAPWDGLLVAAGPSDHIVQLYQDQQFLNRAVCRFAAGAIANGEGVILVPTAAHWEAFRPRLEAEGVNVQEAQDSGQLTVVDADELLPRFILGQAIYEREYTKTILNAMSDPLVVLDDSLRVQTANRAFYEW